MYHQAQLQPEGASFGAPLQNSKKKKAQIQIFWQKFASFLKNFICWKGFALHTCPAGTVKTLRSKALNLAYSFLSVWRQRTASSPPSQCRPYKARTARTGFLRQILSAIQSQSIAGFSQRSSCCSQRLL